MTEDVAVTHRRTRTLLALLLLPVIWLICASPASAHDRLVGTTPASGSSVTSPELVQLKFAEPVVTTGTQVEVKNAAQQVASSDLAITGNVVSVRLTPPATAGTYQVIWRITSDDGHPVSGTFSFRATAAAASSSPASSSATTSSGASSSSTSTPVPTQRVPTNKTNNEPGWIIAGVAVAVAAIAAGVVVSRRRLTDDEPTDGPAGEDD